MALMGWTDAGNTERFVEDHKDDIRYCPDFKKWMLWTGVRWELISTRPLEQAIRSARKLQTSSDPVVKKFGKNSESSRKLNSVIQDAANLPKIHVRLKELDADPWLLNTLSGVVDLRTGSVRPHRNSDFFTKITGVEYDPSAKAPRFEQFMLEVFDHDRELVVYVLRYLGQALTGLPSDRVMQFWYGPAGSNGKSTLINTLLWALGDYAQTMAAGLLLGNSRPLSSANARPDLVALLSARLVVGNETSEDHYFDESLVKQLTGRDRLSVRGNYQDQAQIHPTWTLALASNHKPIVRGGDTAIWDRLHLVPFNVRFTDDGEPRKDPELEGKLKAEAPCILALLVRSCMEWQAEGLRPPPRVLAAVEEYKKSQDTIGEFIEECCIVGDGLTTLRSALYEAFREWSERSGEKNPIGKKRFNQKMEPRFLSAGTGGKTHWIGLSCQHGTAVVRNAVEKGRDRGQRASLGRDPKDNSGSFAGADSTVRRKEIRRLD